MNLADKVDGMDTNNESDDDDDDQASEQFKPKSKAELLVAKFEK